MSSAPEILSAGQRPTPTPTYINVDDPITEAGREYESELRELTWNSKPIINSLTIIAGENIQAAQEIVAVIERRIFTVIFFLVLPLSYLQQADFDKKLPVLYLLDSIVKNIGGVYRDLFARHIVHTFTDTFNKVDEPTRQALVRLLKTWQQGAVFPLAHVQEMETFLSRQSPQPPYVNLRQNVQARINTYPPTRAFRIPQAPSGSHYQHTYPPQSAWGSSQHPVYSNDGYGDGYGDRYPPSWPAQVSQEPVFYSVNHNVPSYPPQPVVSTVAPHYTQPPAAPVAPAVPPGYIASNAHDLARSEHLFVVDSLYYGFITQCTVITCTLFLPTPLQTCGLRFKSREEHAAHLDWHFSCNIRNNKSQQAASRAWFPAAKAYFVVLCFTNRLLGLG